MKDILKKFRQTLHANPELSGQERETQKRIKSILSEYGVDEVRDVGKFGTICTFHFGDGPHVLVRVDIDALAIQETNSFEYKSLIDGVSHKCGHDGHATIGVGLAIKLKEEPLQLGTVSVLFQPAEETGEGAAGVLNDPRFDAAEYDYAIALHNIPRAGLHDVLWRYDQFTQAVCSLVIRLSGKTTHAGHPAAGDNPSYAIAEIITLSLEKQQEDEFHPDYMLITPIHINAGSHDYGIAAGIGEVHFTIRTIKQSDLDAFIEKFKANTTSIAHRHNLKISFEKLAEFQSNENHPVAVDAIKSAATKIGLSLNHRERPFPWGEDFGLFTQKIPGAMFGLGSGVNCPALHNPDYDYPDEITQTGISIFYEAADILIKARGN